VRKIKIIYLF